MDEKKILNAIEELRKSSKERKFKQSVDLLIALKDLNLKKPEEQVELFITLPITRKLKKVAALVGGELLEDSKKYADFTISDSDFDTYDKKKIKKLASEYDYIVGQANLMPKIAKVFGRFLGPKGKMPNPKGGMIIPPKGNIQATINKLKNTVKISAKKQPNIQVSVGTEDMSNEELVKNISYIYDQIVHVLPKHEHNINHISIKFTMSKPVRVGKR